MASVDEEVQDLKIHAFKWNEDILAIPEPYGMFLFRLINPTVKYPKILIVFDLLASPTRVDIERLISMGFDTKTSFSQVTSARLRSFASSYLLSCFQFNTQIVPDTRNPIPVIVVDVYEFQNKNQIGSRAFPSEKQAPDEDEDEDADGDDISSIGEEVNNKRRVEDGGNNNKTLMSQSQCSCDLDVEDICDLHVEDICAAIRSLMGKPLCQPIVSGEPRRIWQVKPAMKVREFNDHETGNVCSICLNEVSSGVIVAETPCKHLFHRDCLFRWLQNTTACPSCRSVCATLI